MCVCVFAIVCCRSDFRGIHIFVILPVHFEKNEHLYDFVC